MHQNIAGFLNKKEMLEVTLSELSNKYKQPIDLLCLSETFIQQNSELNIQLHGFILSTSFCRINKKRGGVCILHHNSIEIKHLPFIKDLASEMTFECCGVEIVNYNIILVCIYRIPGACIRTFFNKLCILLDKLKWKTSKTVILTGDWNIDTLKTTNISRELKELLDSYNFDLHINVPTRRLSCIDHFASNDKESRGHTVPVALSDHETAQILTVPVKKRVLSIQHYYKTVRDFSQENISKFKECISNYPWTELFVKNDTDEAFNYFHTELCLLYNLCFPKYRVKITKKIHKPNWLTKGIRTSCVTKRKLRISYYKNKSVTSKNQYRKYAKLLKKCIIFSQKSKNTNYINKSKNKCRATWQIINNTENYVKINSIDQLNVNNNKIITDPIQIASKFNDYFINLPKISSEQTSSHNSVSLANSSVTFFLAPTDEHEIRNIIKSLNNTNSTGYDELSTKVIKSCIHELSPLLAHLVNLSFKNGQFPSSLKFSVVVPLFKKGEKDDIGNYRPITLIPVLSKIFEKTFHKRLTSFCTRFSIIRSEQHGFQKGKSTSLACFKIIKQISYFMDKRIPVSMILFDLSRAFDYVCHKTLLGKLESYGIRGHAHKWIKSYLEGRVQRVEISRINKSLELTSYTSKYCVNNFGVPQGSILGPLLFILYINDLPLAIKYPCTLFADDISIIINKTKNIDYNTEINETINNVINWLQCNNLYVNISKTKYIQFFNKNGKSLPLSVRHGVDPITEVTTAKFLGITIDVNLTWKEHVSEVCSKINRFTFALYRLRSLCNRETALMAYHGYVCSTLRYGLVLWGNCVDLNRAFLIQKRCLRAICAAGPLDSCKPLFKKLCLLTLPAMYIFELCIFVKINSDLFTKRHETCTFSTRYPNRLLALPGTTTCLSRNSFNMSVRVFNKVPDNIKNLPIKKFKSALFKYLCDKCIYNIENFLT